MLESSGAAGRNRTADLRITNALLYRLSYSGNKARIIQCCRTRINLLQHVSLICYLGYQQPEVVGVFAPVLLSDITPQVSDDCAPVGVAHRR